MRLQRYGKKGQPYYHIVIADGRAPRDGRFIEKIGTYNPLTRPADINLDFDRALYWVKSGAQPTETVTAILKYTGVAYRYHLAKGVTKGAMTEEEAQAKFDAWKSEKVAKIDGARKDHILSNKTADKKRLENEIKVNAAKANELAKKRAAAAGLDAKAQAELAGESVEETVVAAEELKTVAEETPVAVVETPAVEEVVATVEEKVVEEVQTVAEVTANEEVEAVAEVTTTEEVEAATEEPTAKAEESTEEQA